MRKLCAVAGALSLFSLTFYGLTGMALWAPVDGKDGRAEVLILLHLAGIVAGIIALVDDAWQNKGE